MRFRVVVIIIEVKASVEKITAVMVEALLISLMVQQGDANNLAFAQ